jgi:tetratricopeptide (TPR) repeat protein
MAEVFLARRADGTLVALKRLIAEEAELLDLFLDEARVAARFVHPNIVRFHELGWDDAGLYLVLEYVPGHSFAAVLARARQGRPLARDVGAYVIGQVARALAHVHAATDADGAPLGVVHRDVSPGNVLVAMTGEVKLSDFGIAKARDLAHRTRTGVIRGTAAYMSPEQLAGRPIDARSDVWSTGVMLWEATVGRRLFAFREVGGAREQILAAPVPRPSEVDPAFPHELELAVMRALEVDPARRCDAAELVERVDRHLGSLARPPGPATIAAAMTDWFGADEPARPAASSAPTRQLAPSPAAPVAGRRRWPWPAVSAVALAAVLVGTVLGSRAERGTDPPPARDRFDAAWRLAHRGGHEEARAILDELRDLDPADPDVAMLSVLVHWWLGTRQIDPLVETAEGLRLAPQRRTLLHGIKLLHQGRTAEALLALTAEERRLPATAEIAYALGEAEWHAGDRERAVTTLMTAFRRDPSWQMAMHHVLDYRIARGEVADLREAAALVAEADPATASALEITALVAERRHELALARTRDATARYADDALLWQHRAALEVVLGDLPAAEASATRAVALWPHDDRNDGPFTAWAELPLYAGDEAGFEARSGARFSPANILRLALWHDGAGLKDTVPDRAAQGPRKRPGDSAMDPPPLNECLDLLGPAAHGQDVLTYAATSINPEVRAFGAGLAALSAGDLKRAEARFTEGVAAATAATRPLLAYYAARTRRQLGDARGVAEACDEVIRPRGYVPYRAVLLPDCLRWVEAAR